MYCKKKKTTKKTTRLLFFCAAEGVSASHFGPPLFCEDAELAFRKPQQRKVVSVNCSFESGRRNTPKLR